jgi:hypothetical protein
VVYVWRWFEVLWRGIFEIEVMYIWIRWSLGR